MLKIFLCAALLFSGVTASFSQHTDGLLTEGDDYTSIYYDFDEKHIGVTSDDLDISNALLKMLPFLNDKSIVLSVTNTGRKKGILIGIKAGKELFRTGYKRNHLQGVWVRRYPNGLLQDSGNFYNNIPQGEWLSWYENGSLRSIRNYSSAKWFAVQSEVKNRNSKIFFHDLSSSVGFSNRKFENLTKAAASFSSLPSTSKTYEPPFKYCLHHGLFMNYFPNGAVKDSGYYKDGLRDGLWNEFYSNGILSASGSYFKGLKNSGWKYFNKEGRLIMLAEYKHGKLSYRKTYSGF
jgi:antitoxin component YwqK of YwqJK toxin-antitoxin module